MATVAGLNRKFKDAVEKAVKQPFAADSNEYKPLMKDLEEDGEGAKLIARINNEDANRIKLIKHYKDHPPTEEKLRETRQKLQEATNRQIADLTRYHERQRDRIEQQLERRNMPIAMQNKVLTDLEKAQKAQIDGIREISAQDQKGLATLKEDYGRDFATAMILRHLGDAADENKLGEAIMGSIDPRKAHSSEALVAHQAGLINWIKRAIISRSETFQEWWGYKPEDFEEYGGVEAKFAREFTRSDLYVGRKIEEKLSWSKSWDEMRYVEEDKEDEKSTERLRYRKDHKGKKEEFPELYEDEQTRRKRQRQEFYAVTHEVPGAAGENQAAEEDLWNMPQEGYFNEDTKHTYIDLAAAGAMVYTNMALLLFSAMFAGSFGSSFSVEFVWRPKNKELGTEAGMYLSTTAAFGLNAHPQNIHRIAVMAMEAKARGWKSIDWEGIPDNLKQEAYKAARRAGFPHNKIFNRGQLYTSKALIAEGDRQRALIDKARETKRPVEEVFPLMLGLQNMDPRVVSHAEFFAQQPNVQIALLENAATTKEQRADLLTDAAAYSTNLVDLLTSIFKVVGEPNNAPGQPEHLSVEAAVDLLAELAVRDEMRALAAFTALPQQRRNLDGRAIPDSDKQLAVFKGLAKQVRATGLLARILMTAPTPARRIALFNAIEHPTEKTDLLRAVDSNGDAILPLEMLRELYSAIPHPEDEESPRGLVFNDWVEVASMGDPSQLVRLVLATYKYGTGQPQPAQPLTPQERTEAAMSKFDGIGSRMGFMNQRLYLPSVKAAFINSPELSFAEKKEFLNTLSDSNNPLDYIQYREFLSLMTPENAFFYLETKYGQDAFKQEFANTIPFNGQGIDAERLEALKELYEKEFGEPTVAVQADEIPLPNIVDYDRYNLEGDEAEHRPFYLARLMAGNADVRAQVRVLMNENKNKNEDEGEDEDEDEDEDKISEDTAAYVLANSPSNALFDAVMLRTLENGRNVQAASRIITKQDPVRVAQALLRSANRRATVLATFAQPGNSQPADYWAIVQALGATPVIEALRSAVAMNGSTEGRIIRDKLLAMARDGQIPTAAERPLPVAPANPQEAVPFDPEYPRNAKLLAILLSQMSANEVGVIQFPHPIRSAILEHCNSVPLMSTLLRGLNDAAYVQVINGLDENQMTKIFKVIPDDHKQTVFNGLSPVAQETIFSSLTAEMKQASVQAILAAQGTDALKANRLMRLVTPSAINNNQAFYNVLSDDQTWAVLLNATLPRIKFLAYHWGTNENLGRIMNLRRFGDAQDAQTNETKANYLIKVAEVGLSLGEQGSKRFIVALKNLNLQPNDARANYTCVQMLKLLQAQGKKTEAKTLFNVLEDGKKAELKTYIQNQFTEAEDAGLREIVGIRQTAPGSANH